MLGIVVKSLTLLMNEQTSRHRCRRYINTADVNINTGVSLYYYKTRERSNPKDVSKLKAVLTTCKECIVTVQEQGILVLHL